MILITMAMRSDRCKRNIIIIGIVFLNMKRMLRLKVSNYPTPECWLNVFPSVRSLLVLKFFNIVLLYPKVILLCSIVGHCLKSCIFHLSRNKLTGCATWGMRMWFVFPQVCSSIVPCSHAKYYLCWFTYISLAVIGFWFLVNFTTQWGIIKKTNIDKDGVSPSSFISLQWWNNSGLNEF